MQIKNKSKINSTFFKAAPLLIIATAAFLRLSFAMADDNSISQISGNADQAAADKQEKLEELERRAKIYQQIIDIKQKQGVTLNNQILLMDSNLDDVKTQIKESESKISNLNEQIVQIQNQIESKNTTINSQKVMLASLIEFYYEMANQDPTVFFISQNSFTNNLASKDQLSQVGDKVREITESLVQMKNDLQSQAVSLDQKKIEIIDVHKKLQNQTQDLQNVMSQKQVLLQQTKGEEARYQQLLARVEEQKQELLDVDQLAIAGGLSADNYPKPPSSLFASVSWYYSQRDPKWANQMIGNSNSTLKAYGCAVAAVAMVLSEHGYRQTPSDLAKKPIFSWDLISWPGTWTDAKVTMSGDGDNHGNVNWSSIDNQLFKGNPVIVYIKKTNNKGGHYVVIHHKESSTGKYVVHDPYFGANIYLDTSRALVGAMGVNSGTTVDQMIIYN